LEPKCLTNTDSLHHLFCQFNRIDKDFHKIEFHYQRTAILVKKILPDEQLAHQEKEVVIPPEQALCLCEINNQSVNDIYFEHLQKLNIID